MKKSVFPVVSTLLFVFAACNNTSKPSAGPDTSTTDSVQTNVADTTKPVELVHSFRDIDAKFSSSFNEVVNHYLEIKNALVADNGSDAASAGRDMAKALNKVDKSALIAEQKKLYDGIEDDLKEHAEHIGESGDKIEHQREHFSMMSEDVYDLVKAFGAGRLLYHDYCPMANDNKGGMWLDEAKAVKNPYFAGKMNQCVKVQEVIR